MKGFFMEHYIKFSCSPVFSCSCCGDVAIQLKVNLINYIKTFSSLSRQPVKLSEVFSEISALKVSKPLRKTSVVEIFFNIVAVYSSETFRKRYFNKKVLQKNFETNYAFVDVTSVIWASVCHLPTHHQWK